MSTQAMPQEVQLAIGRLFRMLMSEPVSARSVASLICDALIEAMADIEDSERVEIFDKLRDEFCRHCGTEHLPCHCWNDE